ncbi:MAG TPA: hypothetical protein VKT78_04455 [Fimbriimonadaceae bacterium]|nr:hypothetical protein [Fimbriimonadaceae bacterium]
MDSTTETKTTKTAALVTAGVLAGAGIATLATLWLTRKGPFSGRELSLNSLLDNCDQAAQQLENRLLRTA